MKDETERASLWASAASPVPDDLVSKRSDFWNPTLNLRFVEGHCVTFLYSHLQWMNFDPSKGIILHFSTHTVKVVGRNLSALYADLLELKCRHIVVVPEEHDLGEAEAVVVHRVGVTQEGADTRRGVPPS
jgi:hypothetical protein